jgi:hypothetical protein
MQRLGVILKQLEELVPLAGSASDLGKDVLKMIQMASKHVPAGSVTPASQKSNVDRMAMQNAQQNQQVQAMRQQQAQPQQKAA